MPAADLKLQAWVGSPLKIQDNETIVWISDLARVFDSFHFQCECAGRSCQ